MARPHRSALAEVARTSQELAAIGIRNQHLAINGLIPDAVDGDPLAAALAKRDRTALTTMNADIARLPRESFPLRSENLVGIEALRRFATGAPEQAVEDTARTQRKPREDLSALGALVDDIERPGKGLVMFMGKGGVGKRTLAAAVATELAARRHEVLLTTTDPAAHLVETLGGEVPGLSVGRIDPAKETARYRDHVMATKGRTSTPQRAPCSKRTCARPAPRRSPFSRRSLGSSAKARGISW